MNLYEMKGNYTQILQEASYYASQNEGEVSKEIADSLEAEFNSLNDKIEATAMFIKSEVAMEKAIADEIKKLQDRKKVHANKTAWCKKYLSEFVDGKFETAKCKISFRKSTSVLIAKDCNLNLIAPELCDVKITPNKTKLKGALSAGAEIDGVTLETKQNIQVK
jgi:hypothetical protein